MMNLAEIGRLAVANYEANKKVLDALLLVKAGDEETYEMKRMEAIAARDTLRQAISENLESLKAQPVDDPALVFIAGMVNAAKSKQEGYDMAVRWLCLRKDLQEECLAEAQKMIDGFWHDELWAKSERDMGKVTNAVQAP